MKKKSFKLEAIILMLVLALILYLVLKDNFNSVVNTLLTMDFRWLAFAFVFIFVYWLLRSVCLHMIVKQYNNNISLKKIFGLTLITQFFNGITPFSSGGQPMEVYYLSKVGIKPTKGTNIIIQNFIMYQLALITYGVIAVTLNYCFHFFEEVPLLRELTLIGFIINTLVGVVLLFISFSTKFNKFVINLIIKICNKFKLIKDVDVTIDKWSNRLEEFHESANMFKNNKMIFIKGYVYNFLSLTAFYAIPLFVIYGMGNFDIDIVKAIVSSAYVLIIGAFVPIPGGSGGIEFGFLQFFGNFIIDPVLSAALLVWRFITYYLGIILGAIAINFFKGDVKKCE